MIDNIKFALYNLSVLVNKDDCIGWVNLYLTVLFSCCCCCRYAVSNTKTELECFRLFLSSSALSIIIYKRFFDEMINGARDFYFYISIAFLALIPLLSLILTRKEVKNEESN